jgi:hypothetical protein
MAALFRRFSNFPWSRFANPHWGRASKAFANIASETLFARGSISWAQHSFSWLITRPEPRTIVFTE